MKRYSQKSRKLYEAFASDDEDVAITAPVSEHEEELRAFFARGDYKHNNNVSFETKSNKPRYSGLYPIPDELKEALDNNSTSQKTEDKLNEMLDYEENLTEQNYENYFHGVLHLEEIEILKSIRNYNSALSKLHKVGKFFVYNVKNNLQNTQFLNLGKFD